MDTVAGFALLALTSRLFIVNPIAAIPTYLMVTMTRVMGLFLAGIGVQVVFTGGLDAWRGDAR